METGLAGLLPPPSSLPELRKPSPIRNRPFLRGFLTPIFEFPVSADITGRSGGFSASGLCVQKFRSRRHGFERQKAVWKFGILRGKKRHFQPGSQLLWVQSERLELPAPFCRSITKSFDSDTAEQTAFDRRSDEIRGEEGE